MDTAGEKKGHRKLIRKSNEVLLTRFRRQSDQTKELKTSATGELLKRDVSAYEWSSRRGSVSNFLVLNRRGIDVVTI